MIFHFSLIYCLDCGTILSFADVAELADALDLGSSALRCGGSNPPIRTCKKSM